MSVHTGSLVERLKARSTKAGVIGLGYVGLPLAIEFAKAGLTVVGVDLDTRKVDALSKGESYIGDVAATDVAAMVEAGRFRATTDFSALSDVDTINICVPTPLRKTKDPDLSYIVASVEQIAKYLKAGQLIILESTTYPGTTDEVVQPMLEADGLQGRHRLLPGLLARARRSGQPAVPHRQHPEGRRRRQRGLERRRGGALRAGRERGRHGRPAHASRSWSSCSRTPSARSTSASPTSSR